MRTALVTGSSRGIGRAIAETLARQGFGLTVTGRKLEPLTTLVPVLERLGSPHVAIQPADMGDTDVLQTLAALHAERFGSMNALVLSAGIGMSGPVGDFPVARVEKLLRINLVSAVALVQASLPLLRSGAREDPSHGATVIGLSSITGLYAERNLSAYGASKAALTSFLSTVNLEESAEGVKATSILPGYVATDMTSWVTDVAPEDMVSSRDVAAIVEMLLALGRAASIPSIVVSRSGSNGYEP